MKPSITLPNNRFNCSFGIREITRSKNPDKPAKMLIEISDELARKLMRTTTGVGSTDKPKICGLVLEWSEI